MNAGEAQVAQAQAPVEALVNSAKFSVDALDRQLAALDRSDEASAAVFSGKRAGDTDALRGAKRLREENNAKRTVLMGQRQQAASVLANAEAKRGDVQSAAINAAGKFAAAQFVGRGFGVEPTRVVYYFLGLMAVVAVLFPVCLMTVGHSKAAEVKVEAPVAVATKKPAKARDPKRVIAGRKAAVTRKKNKALAAAKTNVVAIAR